MKIGKLRHRITLLVPSGTTSNTVGEEIPSYVEFATVWASIDPVKRRTYSTDEREIEEYGFYDIVIRYLSGLRDDMRIMFKNRIFEIKRIDNIEERNREIHLLCYEKVNP